MKEMLNQDKVFDMKKFGVAGLTTYKLLQSNEAATETSFNEMFKQNPDVYKRQARVSDKTAFFYMGEMVEFDQTKKIFTNPEKEATRCV